MSQPRTFEGFLSAEGLRVALVVGRFNSLIGERLLEGAIDALTRHGANPAEQTIVRVPGAYEIPLAARRAAQLDGIDAVVTLGAVIRGATPHFDYVAGEVAKGVAQVGLEVDKPVIFGVLTTDTIEQAVERAGTKAGNKGFDAAVTAIEMVNLFRAMGTQARG
ncbi:MAG: 6,7-dimethyl-8-ribityllumazine synthase [Alphaproteobacteria bacterium CG_4_10_14_0_2_um_filter_63_37]|nr:MAG: 6,7-dimethyl-8-ribityllumazine synthase [Proteobacteria bacterium CG1_02_64_396]PJA25974.1 MAG: 6,7-dimethyl-8-ribityllumazine synthase [Alphaproteobacteria bacterium CG_4_10_14_0_2_um_filter_63_37]